MIDFIDYLYQWYIGDFGFGGQLVYQCYWIVSDELFLWNQLGRNFFWCDKFKFIIWVYVIFQSGMVIEIGGFFWDVVLSEVGFGGVYNYWYCVKLMGKQVGVLQCVYVDYYVQFVGN